ncbi:MAG TPA: hypothetical protein VFA71_15375 [Terriglobales bacterium]|nr:hypothetical protein [Terriglobales bacterium]
MTFFGIEIRRPQVFGGLLLLALALEAVLASYTTPLSSDEIQALSRSVEITASIKPELRKDPVTDSILMYRVTRIFEPWFDQRHEQKPLPPGEPTQPGPPQPQATRLLSALYRLPFVIFGLWLGGALWWVSRRLFNNEGGYVALALFCLSPLVIRFSSSVNAEIIASWGLFGIVYTAIGVGHTLYSPPRRWPPRIVLLGLAFGFTAAAHLGAALLGIVLAIFFMLYLSPPDRKPAAMAVLAVALVVASVFLWGCYGWNTSLLKSFSQAGQALRPTIPKGDVFMTWFQFPNLPTAALIAGALAIFLAWKRTRYFGNWTPLLVIALLSLLQFPGSWPVIWMAPFAFVFVGGIAADLLESKYRGWAQAVIFVMVATQVVLVFWLR